MNFFLYSFKNGNLFWGWCDCTQHTPLAALLNRIKILSWIIVRVIDWDSEIINGKTKTVSSVFNVLYDAPGFFRTVLLLQEIFDVNRE